MIENNFVNALRVDVDKKNSFWALCLVSRRDLFPSNVEKSFKDQVSAHDNWGRLDEQQQHRLTCLSTYQAENTGDSVLPQLWEVIAQSSDSLQLQFCHLCAQLTKL